jgi:hypothetical protein
MCCFSELVDSTDTTAGAPRDTTHRRSLSSRLHSAISLSSSTNGAVPETIIESYPEWQIPEMNRLLVEHSLHSEILEAIVREGGPRWRAHATEVAGATRGQARQAELNLVDWTRPYADSTFPSAADEHIPTRLGESDRLAHFERPVNSPFGNIVDEITVPGWWVPGLPADQSSAERVASGAGAVEFDLGRYSFTYSRLGLRHRSAASAGVSNGT